MQDFKSTQTEQLSVRVSMIFVNPVLNYMALVLLKGGGVFTMEQPISPSLVDKEIIRTIESLQQQQLARANFLGPRRPPQQQQLTPKYHISS